MGVSLMNLMDSIQDRNGCQFVQLNVFSPLTLASWMGSTQDKNECQFVELNVFNSG